MRRNLRAFGLVLVAAFAMTAMTASAASAAEFHSEASTTDLVGTQVGEDVFTVKAGTVRCSQADYTGTQVGATTTTTTVVPTYGGCRAFGFVNTTVDVSSCGYVFHATGTDGSGNVVGSVDVECEGSDVITVTAFNCWVTVAPQTGLSKATFTNEGSGSSRDVKVDVAISGIKYTQHSKSFPGCSSGTFTDGTYHGTATVKGFSGGTQVGIWAS